MSSDPSGMQGGPAGPPPSEEELRAAYEAELARIDATDMIAQAAVSLLNIGAHRMGAPTAEGGPPVGQDLEQARDAIDAASALLEILERRMPGELAPLRDALSRLQMAYAAAANRGQAQGAQTAAPDAGTAGPPAAPAEGSAPQPPADAPGEGSGQSGPGPAESSGRLWVPGR